MKKLAIFAEGGTECCFVEKLLRSVTTAKDIRIEHVKMKGGGRHAPRHSTRIEIDAESDTQKYYILIVDCRNDERVQSDIRDQYSALCKRGYNAIIGIRDVYPKSAAELPELTLYLYYKIPTKPISPVIVLAVMEVEAWFLAEHTHFLRINETLTLEVVRQTLAFDPSSEEVEQRPHPSDDLNLVYQVAGEKYVKEPAIIQRTVDALDCDRLYLELPPKIESLGILVKAVDDFFTTATIC